MQVLEPLLHIDNLSLIMMALVTFVSICVASFSTRYLKGDSMQIAFYRNLSALVLAVFVVVSADNILLLLASWGTGNLFLTRLMLHKKAWEAARQSSFVALKNFGLGFVFLGSALYILYHATGATSIQAILASSIKTPWVISSSILLLLAAMTQSALWPFHRWLSSSLNSPTPVSAIMHAGLVNGGGFLLTRFAPILAQQPAMLEALFITGIITAMLGTLWKLMQSDIKRMLACSTMGQMGFMVAQCGLGLFPAAIAHLCLHGLFKAYLFLGSGSAAQDKRLDLDYPPSFKQLVTALLCGVLGAYMFSLSSSKNLFSGDTTLFLVLVAMIAGTQFALPIVRGQTRLKIPLAIAASALMGSVYGMSIHGVEQALVPLGIAAPQPLHALHLFVFAALAMAWISILFTRRSQQPSCSNWRLKAYVWMFNASQPHPKTITTHRNQYQF